MNPINNSENQLILALPNKIAELERTVNELKTNPQRIGNGSLAYATFSPFTAGPFTIPAGLKANIGIKFMDTTIPFTYDGKDAINRATLLEPVYSITVDTDDIDHAVPYGGALTPGQANVDDRFRWDYYQSGFSESSGQRYVNISLRNMDSATHDYWVHGTAIIPRPALKPQ